MADAGAALDGEARRHMMTRLIDFMATPRGKRALIAVSAAALLYLIVGFLAVPAVVKSQLSKRLPEVLQREVRIGTVRANPVVFSMQISEVEVLDTDGSPFFGFERLYVNLQLVSSVLHLAPVIRQVELTGAAGRIVRTGPQSFNFSDLIAGSGEVPPAGAPAKAVPGFRLGEVRITDASLQFDDRFVDSEHRLALENLHLTDLSSFRGDREDPARLQLTARVDGAGVGITASANPFLETRPAEARVTVDSLDAVRYLAYLPKPEATLESAFLDLDLTTAFRMDAETPTLTTEGTLRLREVTARDGDGEPLAAVPAIAVSIGPSDILASQVHLRKVAVASPDVHVLRRSGGDVNVLDAVPELPDATASEPSEPTPVEVDIRIDEVTIEDGTLVVTDRAAAGPFESTIAPFRFSLRRFALGATEPALFELAAATESDETLALSGELRQRPWAVRGVLELSGVKPEKYGPYTAPVVNFDVVEGRIDVQTGFDTSLAETGVTASLAGAGVSIRDLKLLERQSKDVLAAVSQLAVTDTEASTSDRSIRIGRVALAGGELKVKRSTEGELNLANLMAAVPPSASMEQHPTATSEATAAPWQIQLDALDIREQTVNLEDRVPKETVSTWIRFDQISAGNLSTRENETGKVSVKMTGERGGTGQINGTVQIAPLAVDVAVDLKDMDIRASQPYYTDKVMIIVTKGRLSTKGRLKLRAATPPAPPLVRYNGNLAVSDFASLDKEDTRELLNWEELYLDGIELSTDPLAFNVAEVSLSDFYSRLIIDDDGTINLSDIIAREAPPGAASEGESTAVKKTDPVEKPEIFINAVTLQNGHVEFSDYLNQFNFNADLKEIGGRIEGLSSLDAERADVLLQGRWEDHAPLEIKGKVNPLADKRFADVTMTISDIDLSPFSPYSGKYLGYKLEKGKLTLELGYEVDGNRLSGDNRAYFKELTLGDRVDSEEATKLPVALAIALLKDPNNQINLDVPVQGDLDDPQFSLFRTILRALGNAILKVVTAPFAWIGSAVGADEELSYVDFEPGSTALTPAITLKLDTLGTALGERPGLNMEIKGILATETDPDALRQAEFERLIKSQKLRRMVAQGQKPVPLEEITIAPEEFDIFLKAAYDASDIPKPRDESGRIKELPPEEMEKLLLTQFIYDENDLRLLAMERAEEVKTYLIVNGNVGADRLYIVEPDTGDPDEIGESRAPRVVFSLQ